MKKIFFILLFAPLVVGMIWALGGGKIKSPHDQQQISVEKQAGTEIDIGARVLERLIMDNIML